MSNVLHNYLNVIKILKLAKLSDEQYKKLYEDKNYLRILDHDVNNDGKFDIEDETGSGSKPSLLENTYLSDQDIEETGVSETFNTMLDLFLHSRPYEPLERFIALQSKLKNKKQNKNESEFVSQITQTYPEKYLRGAPELDELINKKLGKLAENLDHKLSDHKYLKIVSNIKTKLGSEQKSDIIDFLVPFYVENIIPDSVLFSMVEHYVNLNIMMEKANKLIVGYEKNKLHDKIAKSSTQFVNELFNLGNKAKSMEGLPDSQEELIKEIVAIRESDMFDFLKNTKEWKELGLDGLEELPKFKNEEEKKEEKSQEEPKENQNINQGNIETQIIEFPQPDREAPTNPEISTKVGALSSFMEAFAILKKI